MSAGLDETKGDRTTRVAKKGGRIAAGLAGRLGAPAAVYGLVATFGTASTGTAISTLSGAAAAKATLAALGFGALTAGGGGVAVGVGVLALVGIGARWGAKKLYDKMTTSKD